MDNILKQSLVQVSSLIRKKEVSPVEITHKILNQIEAVNKSNNAFITVCKDTALAEAVKAESDIMNGNYKGPLHGVPLSVKDNISVKNTRCTNGAIFYKDYVSQNDAFIVQQLRSEGAIITGKTNLDEFANHVMGLNKNYGTMRNPLNDEHSAGGSSGGSAVSVASNMSYGSIGTDTSGSVRIPAASCGIVGLKPSYNLLPTHEVNPLSWSLDHVGILSKDCKDLSLLFNAIVPGAKREPRHPDINIDEITIGIPENYFFESLEKIVENKIRKVIDIFVSNGATVMPIKFENMKKVMGVQETIIGAEAAYLHKHNLVEYKEHNEVDFFENGLTISKSEYNKALAMKQKISQDFQKKMSEFDVMLTPSLPIRPPKLSTKKIRWGENEEDILNTLSRFTGPFNVSGLPALSVPVGLSPDRLPIGLQIIGNMYSENQLISVGNWIMEKTL